MTILEWVKDAGLDLFTPKTVRVPGQGGNNMFKKAKIKAKIWALAHMIYLTAYLVHSDPDLKKVLEHSNIAIGKGVLTINETENDTAEEAAKPTRSIFDDLEEE